MRCDISIKILPFFFFPKRTEIFFNCFDWGKGKKLIIQNDINYINKINAMLSDDNTWLYRNIEHKIVKDLFLKLKEDHFYFCFCMVFYKIRTALNNVLKGKGLKNGY